MIDSLRDLANTLDDLGLPSLTVDNIRREFISMKVAALQRMATSNDNATNQSGERR